jgi:hypothetical protein
MIIEKHSLTLKKLLVVNGKNFESVKYFLKTCNISKYLYFKLNSFGKNCQTRELRFEIKDLWIKPH